MRTPQEINDSLDSLHQRMDRFYAFASQLMIEHRNIKQRIGFLEAKALLVAGGGDDEDTLLATRLQAAKNK